MSSTKKQPRYRTSSHGPAQRNKFRLSALDRLYLTVAAVESLIVSGLVLSAFLILHIRAGINIPRLRGTALYMSTFVLASIFSLVYAYDALRAHNVVQLLLHLVFELCLLTWAAIEIWQTRIALDGLDIAGPCILRGNQWDCLGPGTLNSLMFKVLMVVPFIILACMLVFTFVSHRLYEQFGWEVYRLVNASPALKRMHRNYQAFQSLIKMLFFFASAFCMMYIIIIPLMWRKTAELVITVIALPVFYPTLFILMWAVKREHTPIMAVGLLILSAGEAYFIYKMVSLFLPSTGAIYTTCKVTLAVFSGFAIALTALTIVFGLICMAHFGSGLAQCHNDAANKNQWWRSRKEEEAEMELDSHVPFLVDK